MNSLPPRWNSAIFNTNAFIGGEYLTRADADRLYLQIAAGKNLGLIDGITSGIVYPSKAVIVDSNSSISGFNQIGVNSISMTSTTSSIVMSSTLANSIQTAGGISVGGVVFGATQVAYLTNITTGTAQASKALVLDSSGNISSINSLSAINLTGTLQTAAQPNITSHGILTSLTCSGTVLFTNSNVSTTSTLNSVQLSGGLYMAKAILNNSFINFNTQFSGSSHGTSITQAICMYDNPILFRSQNGSNTDNGIMYSKNSSWNSGLGFASANLDGPVLFGNQAVIIGNLNSSNTETICATFNNTTTNLLGTTNIKSPPVSPATLNVQSFSNQLGLIYNSTGYTTFSSSGGSLTINCVNTSGYLSTTYSYVFDCPSQFSTTTTSMPRLSLSGSFLPTSDNNFRIHLGGVAGDIQLVLYNASNITPSYGLGANSSALQYISAGVNGHRFYNSSSQSGNGANIALGSLVGSIDQYGNYQSPKGLRATGFDSTGMIGSGAEMVYTNSTAYFFGYDRTNGLWKSTQLGSSLIVSTLGSVGIGAAPTTSYWLDVQANTQNLTGPYGFFTASGTSGSTGSNSGNQTFSAIFRGRIAVAAEVDVYSDYRLKENIENIDDEYAQLFINCIQPKIYNKKSFDRKELGYIAQDLVRLEYNEIYCLHPTEINEVIEDDGFINPKDQIFAVNYTKIVPILHKALQISNRKIDDLQAQINELRDLLNTKANKRTRK